MKNQTFFKSALNLLLALLMTSPTLSLAQSSSSNFTLEKYLKQVMVQNVTLKSNALSSQSFRLRVGEGNLDFMPYAIGQAQYSDDKRIASFNSALGTEAIGESGYLGVQQKFRTGTLVALQYNLAMSQVLNSPFYGVPNYIAYTAAPEISITQPLWKDFNASMSKAMEESVLAGLKSQEIASQYSSQQILSDAENIYWTLVIDREIVKLDRESIERTDKILKRNQKRVSMNVADRSDLLQSLASIKTKELNYQKDVEDLRQASLKFNSFRNVSNDAVAEILQNIDDLQNFDASKDMIRKGIRGDLKIAIADAQNQRALAKSSEVKNQPDISLVGTYQFNGRGSNAGLAMGTSWNGDNPYYTAALNLKIPLDWSEVDRLNEGYRAQAAAAEAKVERAKFDLDQEWIDLSKHYQDANSRLTLARELEKLQGEKLKYERERFSSGRTTSFQVLQFEDNFSDASLARLRVANELLTMRAKARLYNGDVQ